MGRGGEGRRRGEGRGAGAVVGSFTTMWPSASTYDGNLRLVSSLIQRNPLHNQAKAGVVAKNVLYPVCGVPSQ